MTGAIDEGGDMSVEVISAPQLTKTGEGLAQTVSLRLPFEALMGLATAFAN